MFSIVLTAMLAVVSQNPVEELQRQLDALKAGSKPAPASPVKASQSIADHLQDISVTIVAEGSEGSGVIMTRQRDTQSFNFVWTAAHVVDGLKTTRPVIDPVSGSQKIITEFKDAKIVKSLVEKGRMVGKLEMFAEVIRFSAEEDLAILKVRKQNFVVASTTFYLDDTIPPIGTELYHVGSLLGQMGSNSMTRGIMSQHGRLISNKVFDQTTCAAFPGSSGGGVYLEDRRLVGLVLRGSGETFNLIVPSRRMREWAKTAKVEWTLDPAVPVPSDADMAKIPVDDIGATFRYATTASDKAPVGGGRSFRWFGKGINSQLGSDEMEMKFPTLLVKE